MSFGGGWGAGQAVQIPGEEPPFPFLIQSPEWNITESEDVPNLIQRPINFI